jgi:hypothetical protein
MPLYPYNQRADITSSTSVTIPFVKGVADGYKEARGVVVLDGTNPTPIATGLAAVVGASASLISTGHAAGDPITVTVGFTTSTGNLDIHAWKFTSTAVTTLIASTSSGYSVAWVAAGV